MKRLLTLTLMAALVFAGGFADAFNAARQVEFPLSGILKTDGSINSGGKMYTCDAGTVCGPSSSDPRTTWQDADKSAAHANPIVLDSLGTSTVFADGNYKFQIYDSDDNLIVTIDDLEYTPETTTTTGVGLTVRTITDISNTVESTDDNVLCNATDDNVVTDMTAVSAIGNTGKRITFKKIDATTNTCTVDPLGSQTMDGNTTIVLATRYEDLTIVSDGANWRRIVAFDAEHKGDGGHDTITVVGTSNFFNGVIINDTTFSLSNGVDIASASTLTLGSDGNYFDVTGTTDISAINTVGVGTTIKLHFDGKLALIYNATDLILPGLSNVITNAGDEFEFTEYAAGDWRVTGKISSSPSFSVHKGGSAQTNVGTALDKITWDVERFDTNNDFALGGNQFLPTVAGKYLLSTCLSFTAGTVADGDGLRLSIHKNGSGHNQVEIQSQGGTTGICITAIHDANGTTDYFEVFGANETLAATVDGSFNVTFFMGSRIGQ